MKRNDSSAKEDEKTTGQNDESLAESRNSDKRKTNKDERKEEDEGKPKKDKIEGRKGLIHKAIDFLIFMVLLWLLFKDCRRQLQKSEPPKGVSQNSSVVVKRRPAPKPVSLPDPPPSPPPDRPGRQPSPDHYDQFENFIFVGGIPGAGTSLMRAILDAHPDVRCGNGVDIIARLMQTWRDVAYNNNQLERMKLGGVKEGVIDISMIMFLFEILVNNGPPAPRMCTSDPLSMMGGRYLLHLYQNMKMVFVIRDIRAAAYSLIRNKMMLRGSKMKDFEVALRTLDNIVHTMRQECIYMGVDRCLPVRYEDLVLKPRETMEGVLRFLDLPWKEEVLHHYHYANKTGVISEPTSNDTQPIYDSSLTSWVGQIPRYLTDFHSFYYGNLQFIGYDPEAYPPDYSSLPPYNWTKPVEPVRGMKNAEEFRRMMAKLGHKVKGIKV